MSRIRDYLSGLWADVCESIAGDVDRVRGLPLDSGGTTTRSRRSGTRRIATTPQRLRRMGWRLEGREATGFYHTPIGAWRGRIECRGRTFRVWIYDPPAWLFEGPHGACVHDRGERGVYIHENTPQESLEDTIAATEAFVVSQARFAKEAV